MNVIRLQNVWYADIPLRCIREGQVVYLDRNKQRAVVETKDGNQRSQQFACTFSDLFPSFEEAKAKLDDTDPDEITSCVSGMDHLDMDFQSSVVRLGNPRHVSAS